MAQPTTRTEFTEWCLRKLGKPVIEINVDQDQAQDRIDEALSYYWDYHFDGTERTFFKHQITASDITNQYITVPESIIGVINLFPVGSSITASTGMFNVQYQFVLNNMTDLTSYNLTHYYMTMQHIEFMQEILVGKPMIRYNKHVNKLFIDSSIDHWSVGNYIIIEAYDIIDPDEYADVWSERWLQNYAAVLVREQWGLNLTKFTNMQLVGGVSFNGDQILQEARAEREKMEEEAISNLQPLTYNFIG